MSWDESAVVFHWDELCTNHKSTSYITYTLKYLILIHTYRLITAYTFTFVSARQNNARALRF